MAIFCYAMLMKVYLAGQWNEHDNNWKQIFDVEGCEFHDPEIHSDQTSADTYFPDDLNGVKEAEIMIANPGLAPSEGTWIEIGYYYATHTKNHGEPCNSLIIIWPEQRTPKWSLEFVNKTGYIVSTAQEAKDKLLTLVKH